MIYYQVRFVYYQYNTGRANNGHYTHRCKFDTLKDAENFAKEVWDILQSGEDTHAWLWENCYFEGFIERFDGIYEIIERKIS